MLSCERSEVPIIAAAISDAGAWREVASLADRWSVFPVLASRTQARITPIPAEESAALVQKTSIQFFLTVGVTSISLRAGCEALYALSRSQIPAVAFKGAAVIAHLHRGQLLERPPFHPEKPRMS